MKKNFLTIVFAFTVVISVAQNDVKQTSGIQSGNFIVEKSILATPVKNQAVTGTCWAFSTTSLLESQALKKNLGSLDLSEMFTVRNIYIEKARNYIMRQGHTQFGEGGLGHDLIRSTATYGAIPENVYSGLNMKHKTHNHQQMVEELKNYLDSVLNYRPIPSNWQPGYEAKLDAFLGVVPANFDYNGKKYTPKTFASDVLKFDPNEYVNITSFTHHPYYAPFIIEVPDNFSNGSYYNLPLDEMIQLTKSAIRNGYSVMWDADVSNTGFMQNKGIALYTDTAANMIQKNALRALRDKTIKDNKKEMTDAEISNIKNKNPQNEVVETKNNAQTVVGEGKWDAYIRQALFENLTTQDDHLMHITGIEKTPEGKTFFLVKNSWGDVGPEHGYINVSEAYFAINTVSLIIPKAAISKELLAKLGIK